MNDFLHSLRNNNRRFDRNRKSYDNNGNYNHNDRRRPKEGNFRHQRKNVDQETLAEIREIKKNLQGMVANQTKLIDVIERIAVVLEQNAIIDTGSAAAAAPAADPSGQESVDRLAGEPPVVPADTATTATVDGVGHRPQIISRINELRAKGMSYEKIAQRLDLEKVATLSGRGKWRGQSVYRLFQQQT
jgi:hypothetical protein